MLNSHLIRCRLGSVVLIRVDSEEDSAANCMLLPEGSGGTPRLRASTAPFVRFNKIVRHASYWILLVCRYFLSHASGMAQGHAVKTVGLTAIMFWTQILMFMRG